MEEVITKSAKDQDRKTNQTKQGVETLKISVRVHLIC